ncbi:MAG: hypothetical protein H6Q60_1238 [Oscillospiraceae bacterium]|nr:hypothetical protein [Oscillospiraceae bacterium]
MTGWIVLAGVLCLLVLLLWSRIRGIVIYGQDELSVRLKWGFFSFYVYPPKEKKEQSKKKQSKKDEQTKNKSERGGTLSLFRELLPLAIDVLGDLKRTIRVDLLYMRVVWGADDPAEAAVGFGAVNAAVGMIFPILENHFTIRTRQIETAVEFNQRVPTVFVRAKISLRVGSAILIFIQVLRRGFPVYQKWKAGTSADAKARVKGN